MRILELTENYTQFLYHATYPDNAVSIILDNKIDARTDHFNKSILGFKPSDKNDYDKVNGVSLTRNIQFAKEWHGGTIFKLDGNKLKHNYRMKQIDYYKTRREAEEFLVGPINNLDRYLISILMSQKVYDECYERDEDYLEEGKLYTDLLNHPKLVIY